MMFSLSSESVRSSMQWATISLGALSLVIITYAIAGSDNAIEGRLLPSHMQGRTPWITIDAAQVMSGTTIPAHSNVILQIPEEVSTITRRTLFGRRGDTTLYWGYCFPKNLKESQLLTKRGFPGKIFLSEAERAKRREKLIQQRRRTFSIFKNLTDQDLNDTQRPTTALIRHQLDVMTGGTDCYVMTEKELPVGVDFDDDILNSALERAFGTDPNIADTDADGIIDGLEVFRLGTHPTKRDSDGDGIIDGYEDINHNGRVDPTETDPTDWDTDRDGLCDGYCLVNRGQDFRGEDKNVNGIYEPLITELPEYNPRTEDSDGDGILDEHEVYLCILAGGSNC